MTRVSAPSALPALSYQKFSSRNHCLMRRPSGGYLRDGHLWWPQARKNSFFSHKHKQESRRIRTEREGGREWERERGRQTETDRGRVIAMGACAQLPPLGNPGSAFRFSQHECRVFSSLWWLCSVVVSLSLRRQYSILRNGERPGQNVFGASASPSLSMPCY